MVLIFVSVAINQHRLVLWDYGYSVMCPFMPQLLALTEA